MSQSQTQIALSVADETSLTQRQCSEVGELSIEEFSINQCQMSSPTQKKSKEIKQNEATLSTSTLSDSSSVPDVPNKEPSTPFLIVKDSSFSKSPQKQSLPLSSIQAVEAKLNTHLSKMMKCDKYIRMVTSIIKTYRAFEPKNKFVRLYKELIICRQMIRWESKYQTTIELAEQQLSLPMKAFKIFQLFGDLTDLSSFWLTTIFRGTKKHQRLIDNLDQIEANCYFIQCCINFLTYTFSYCKLKLRGQGQKDAKKRNESGWKAVKYLLDVVTSYNNSSLKKKMGQVNPKIAGLFTAISSVIGLSLMWR